MGIGAGAAAAIGAGISAAGSIAGSAMQSGATGRAAGAAQRNQEMLYKIQEAKLAPYEEQGRQAFGQLGDILNINGPEAAANALNRFQASPGYQWQLDQGLRAVDAGAAADSGARGGAVLKAEQTFGQGLANQDFNNYVNNLFKLSQFGQNSALQESTNAGAVGGNLSNIALGQGAAESSIYGNAAKGIGQAANQLLSNQGFQDWLGGGSAVDTAINRANGLAPSYGSTPTGGLFYSAGPGVGTDAFLPAVY